jgi:hypothetical protein
MKVTDLPESRCTAKPLRDQRAGYLKKLRHGANAQHAGVAHLPYVLSFPLRSNTIAISLL